MSQGNTTVTLLCIALILCIGAGERTHSAARSTITPESLDNCPARLKTPVQQLTASRYRGVTLDADRGSTSRVV